MSELNFVDFYNMVFALGCLLSFAQGLKVGMRLV